MTDEYKRSYCISRYNNLDSDIHIPNIPQCPTTGWQFRLWPVLISIYIHLEQWERSSQTGVSPTAIS